MDTLNLMNDKWSHELIITLLNLAQTLANRNNKPYCLTKGMHVIPETRVLNKQGYEAILETCNPHKENN